MSGEHKTLNFACIVSVKGSPGSWGTVALQAFFFKGVNHEVILFYGPFIGGHETKNGDGQGHHGTFCK